VPEGVDDTETNLEESRIMLKHTQEIVDTADCSAELNQIATDWWRDSGGALVPGEDDGVTVFEILFQDECRYFGFTGTSVFERLVELSNGLVDVRSNFVGEHCRQLSYVVRCVASSLDRGTGRELRELLVARALDGVSRIDGTTAMSPKCQLKAGDDDVEVFTFAEWAKMTSGGLK
jgi:hypothetical protein